MKKTYLHSLPLRIWHWANALVVISLIITGFKLRLIGVAASPAHNAPLLMHRYAGWAMVISSAFWMAYGLLSGHLARHYTLRRHDMKAGLTQAKFYLFSIFRGEENPFRPSPGGKFNPLQKLAYGSIMCIFTAILMITGVLFSDLFFFRKFILQLNAMKLIDAIHVAGAYVFVLYLIVHLYMSTLGWKAFAHIKAMFTGYHEQPGEPGNGANSKLPPFVAAAAGISADNILACHEGHEEDPSVT